MSLIGMYVFNLGGLWDHYTTLCLGVLVPSQTPNLTPHLYCVPGQDEEILIVICKYNFSFLEGQ